MNFRKVVLLCFIFIFLCSSAGIMYLFIKDNSVLKSVRGGYLTEASVDVVGKDYNFNPLLIRTPFERDISSLVFSGLMKYDSKTGKIVDDVAFHELSENKKEYTFTIKKDVTWHDGQTVTSNDVIFTFRDVIQNPSFHNKLLKQAFDDVKIERVNEKKVKFVLPEARKTFFTNFTIGLLPRHIITKFSIDDFENLDFNQNPIGCGDFKFESFIPRNDYKKYHETRLRSFNNNIKITGINLRSYPDWDALLSDLNDIDAIKPVMKLETSDFEISNDFKVLNVVSPKYLGLFFNTKNDKLNNKKIRQALRAAIDTNAMAKKFKGRRIDTPLVETWSDPFLVNLSKKRAGELLNELGYFYKSEIPVKSNITKLQYINTPFNEHKYHTLDKSFYIQGSVPDETRNVYVNNYKLRLFNYKKKSFSYKVGATPLKYGENKFKVEFKDVGNKKITEENFSVILYKNKLEMEVALKNNVNTSIVENRVEINTDSNFRLDKNANHLNFDLSYISGIQYIEDVAIFIQSELSKVGVEVNLNRLSSEEFSMIKESNYDMLIVPQHLGYNLDIYPYFHLSQATKEGFNYSNWKNLDASYAIEKIRETYDIQEHKDSIYAFRDIIISDTPAVFLFTPIYSWFYNKKIEGISMNHMVNVSDRFSIIDDVFLEKKSKVNFSFGTFFDWFFDKNKALFL